jgi:hypothetical protein
MTFVTLAAGRFTRTISSAMGFRCAIKTKTLSCQYSLSFAYITNFFALDGFMAQITAVNTSPGHKSLILRMEEFSCIVLLPFPSRVS